MARVIPANFSSPSSWEFTSDTICFTPYIETWVSTSALCWVKSVRPSSAPVSTRWKITTDPTTLVDTSFFLSDLFTVAMLDSLFIDADCIAMGQPVAHNATISNRWGGSLR